MVISFGIYEGGVEWKRGISLLFWEKLGLLILVGDSQKVLSPSLWLFPSQKTYPLILSPVRALWRELFEDEGHKADGLR